MTDALKAHYDSTFADKEGELYEPLAGLDLLAHNRRMELLDSIALPDLTDKVVVDYGVGSWGFGCIFPRLKTCRHAIGFDISEAAIELSAKVSAADPDLAGKTVEYFVSLGYSMPIDDALVDVFFCGECIEHVEDTSAFLAEVHRVLKPGGIAIFTTPNAEPFVYRQLGLKWCVGFEHVALMNFEQFARSLERFFEPVDYLGFNQSIFPGADKDVAPDLAAAWAKSGNDRPQDATSLIAIVRKDNAVRLGPSRIRIADWTAAKAATEAPAEMNLLGESTGGMVKPGNRLEFDVPEGMTRANLIFWAHQWSGIARVRAGDRVETVNLYSHAGGCERLVITDLDCSTLCIEASGERDPRAHDDQIILYRIVFASGPEAARA